MQEKVEAAWGLRKKPSVTLSAVDDAAEDIVGRLRDELTQIVVDLLKLDADDISSDKILLDLGFDSIGLTTFANAVNEKYQLDLTPVLFFDYPSIDEIATTLELGTSAAKHSVFRAVKKLRLVLEPLRAATGGQGRPGWTKTNG